MHPPGRRLISTGSPFEASAGYSRAVVDGDFCFVAGTTGYDYTTMQMPEDVGEQTRNCFRTIGRALDEAGFGLTDVVRAPAPTPMQCSRSAAMCFATSAGRRDPGGNRAAAARNAGRNRGHGETERLNGGVSRP
jgi:hypothetical protein